MIDNNVLLIGNRSEIDKSVRTLIFTEQNEEGDCTQDSEQTMKKYFELNDTYKHAISNSIKMLAGGDNFGYNLKIIDKWYRDSKASRYLSAKLIGVAKPDKNINYLDQLRSLMKTNHPVQELQKNIIKIYCDNFLISTELLYNGEGEIYYFDEKEFDTDDFKAYKESPFKCFNTTMECIINYKKYLEDKYPNFKARSNIIETKYAKIKSDGSYLMLLNKSNVNIKKYIDHSIEVIYEVKEDVHLLDLLKKIFSEEETEDLVEQDYIEI